MNSSLGWRLARPITVTAPLGTVMNATHPAAVNGRTSTCQRAADLVIGALAQAAPERCIAAGNGSCATASFAGADPKDGHLWVYLETIGGGSGARARKDGLDGVHVHMINTSNLPVEALEVEYLLTVLRYELVDGSCGGMGLRRVYRAEAECHLRLGRRSGCLVCGGRQAIRSRSARNRPPTPIRPSRNSSHERCRHPRRCTSCAPARPP